MAPPGATDLGRFCTFHSPRDIIIITNANFCIDRLRVYELQVKSSSIRSHRKALWISPLGGGAGAAALPCDKPNVISFWRAPSQWPIAMTKAYVILHRWHVFFPSAAQRDTTMASGVRSLCCMRDNAFLSHSLLMRQPLPCNWAAAAGTSFVNERNWSCFYGASSDTARSHHIR